MRLPGHVRRLLHAFGLGDPKPSGVKTGLGALTGGNLGPVHYTSEVQTWARLPHGSERLDHDHGHQHWAAVIDVCRARLDCHVKLHVKSNGPIKITLAGCDKVVSAN